MKRDRCRFREQLGGRPLIFAILQFFFNLEWFLGGKQPRCHAVGSAQRLSHANTHFCLQYIQLIPSPPVLTIIHTETHPSTRCKTSSPVKTKRIYTHQINTSAFITVHTEAKTTSTRKTKTQPDSENIITSGLQTGNRRPWRAVALNMSSTKNTPHSRIKHDENSFPGRHGIKPS